MSTMIKPPPVVIAWSIAVSLLFAGASALADDLIATHRISAALANEAVGAAVSACAAQGYAESAALVDIDGVTQAALRGDGAGVHTPDSASDKAYTSVSLRSDTQALVDSVQSQLTPAGPFSKLPRLLLFGGGVVIKLGTEAIGAIGAAGAPGGKLDDACARAGLDKIRDRLR
ncbi:MAG TPA: heme-binding protein [Aliidongia sp.]|nr:heme-binding protein [Aliidongia sp.]